MASSISYIHNGAVGNTTAQDKEHSLAFNLSDVDKKATGLYPLQLQGTAPFTDEQFAKYPYGMGSLASDKEERFDLLTGDNKFAPFKGMTMDEVVRKMNQTLFIPNYANDPQTDSPKHAFTSAVRMYNRFKLLNPNTILQKGFAHVFFVRPSCNIVKPGTDSTLVDALKNHELFSYVALTEPTLIGELTNESTIKGSYENDFMLSLSNAAQGFTANDEMIETNTYGQTYTGYKIAYGKHNVQSKTAGNFSVEFMDDRDSRIYQIIRLWVEYISGVYRGSISPTVENIKNKILDYTSAVYYIVTAEDNETILFWSKYYGVFPTNIPATQYSWGAGSTIKNPNPTIEFMYSFKKDYSPYTILEFNKNARISAKTDSEPIFDPNLMHVGRTMVGTPFIVTDKTDTGQCLKLKYKRVN